MKTGYLGILLLLGLWSSAASASDWWFIRMTGQAPNRSMFYVDRESIQVTRSGSKRVWTQYQLETPNGRTRSTLTLFDVDCENRTSALVSATNYTSDGDLIDTFNWSPYDRDGQPAPIAPDTVFDTLMRFVCVGVGDAIHVTNSPRETSRLFFALPG
jgi:hypothetical protein